MNRTLSAIHQPSKALHVTLWIAQILLAAVLLMAGYMKTATPIAQLAQMMPWTGQVSAGLVRANGLLELLAAAGLLLPALLRSKPVLTPIAATGVAVAMVLAMIFHIARGEASVIGLNVFVLVLALFVAWGRFNKAPIEARA